MNELQSNLWEEDPQNRLQAKLVYLFYTVIKNCLISSRIKLKKNILQILRVASSVNFILTKDAVLTIQIRGYIETLL